MYRYFVSYAYFQKASFPFLNTPFGFGSIAIERSYPIASFDDIQETITLIRDAMIRETKADAMEVSIISFQPFEPDVERIKPPATTAGDNILAFPKS